MLPRNVVEKRQKGRTWPWPSPLEAGEYGMMREMLVETLADLNAVNANSEPRSPICEPK